jgi:hypothetical protein
MVYVISWLVAALRSFAEGSRNEAEVHNDIRAKSSIQLGRALPVIPGRESGAKLTQSILLLDARTRNPEIVHCAGFRVRAQAGNCRR